MTRCVALALAGFLLAAPASALTYYCKVTPQGSDNWIPPDMSIDLDEATSSVTVWDGLIKATVGKPVDGQLRSVNDTRYLFGWTVPKLKDTSGQYTPGFTFSLNIIRATGEAQVTAHPQGYSNSFRGKGACALQ